MTNKPVRIAPQQADIDVATYVFSYFKYQLEVPSLQEVGRCFDYTRQAAYARFKRFERFGVLRKEGHGEYKMQPAAEMPAVFEGLFRSLNKNSYLKLYAPRLGII